MPAAQAFRVLVASDGSLSANAALVTAAHWPWPESTRAFGIVAQPLAPDGRATLRSQAAVAYEEVRANAVRILERRWPKVQVRRYQGHPAAMIVRQAQRTQADLIVMGWRGHGVMRRLLVGSVSRAVVRHAPCSVLVVRRASRQLRRIVLGYDGSANADRAIRYTARLAPADAAVTLVMAVHLAQMPSRPLISAAAAGTLADSVKRDNARRTREARRMLENAAAPLAAAGLKIDYVVTDKPPLDALLSASTSKKADLLVVGATGATGLADLLIGSVAQGALDRSSAPVLVVR